MRLLLMMMVVAGLVLTTACKTKGHKSTSKPVAKAKAPEPAVVSEPKETPKEKAAPKAKPKKKIKLPLGMVPIPILVKKVGMSPDQILEVRKAYRSFNPRVKKAVATIKAASDKDAAHEATTPLRKEIFSAVRAICTQDQKAKFNAYLESRWAAQRKNQK